MSFSFVNINIASAAVNTWDVARQTLETGCMRIPAKSLEIASVFAVGEIAYRVMSAGLRGFQWVTSLVTQQPDDQQSPANAQGALNRPVYANRVSKWCWTNHPEASQFILQLTRPYREFTLPQLAAAIGAGFFVGMTAVELLQRWRPEPSIYRNVLETLTHLTPGRNLVVSYLTRA